MGTDKLIELLSAVSEKLIPIAILVLLIYIIVLVVKLIKTLKLINSQIVKLDEPLATVQGLSKTVDEINVTATNTVKNGLSVVNSKLEAMKNKKKEKEMVEENDYE